MTPINKILKGDVLEVLKTLDVKAFQVTISNVRYERNGKMVTFPLPMCSRFRKF